MKYIGIQTQQRRNNIRSLAMLFLFPCVLLLLTWIFFYILNTYLSGQKYPTDSSSVEEASYMFLQAAPWVVGVTVVWFLVAYFANTAIINASTGAQPLERRDNKRVYNLVENLCITSGMDMPKINIIEDSSLNAFASGLNKRDFTVTLSRGIIDKLDDEELEAVIAHELTHIRNNDVKVLVISIVFVGIFSFLSQILLRTLFSGGIVPYYITLKNLALLNKIWVYIIPSIYNVFNILIFRTFFEGLPESMEESAKIDGANDLRIMWSVILPLSAPVFATLALFTGVTHWNDWFTGEFYVTSNKLHTVQNFLLKVLQENASHDSIDSYRRVADAKNAVKVSPESIRMAVLMTVCLPIMCVYPFLQKYFVKGVLIGAIKG
ncbi:MAG: hypothetical protein BGN96_00480 [Bacteroidales bacterium 45-6]|nr:MAG: hypothetical protein BGN96_00480 [Bacteroidales bacterium 45-6]